ncbi:GntR family transcriptional regulator [Microbacterium murale]|uniref:GntR family transcriptional regulator n=1 Tax=Microbacterium murale TaxID=1081040 RepID=A0ABU0P957_9MICO|nr:GntR family transcriptional regulator [Microbacterium murale]MDQ0643873.1 GntR family transcriptional regulator [Microbacterium murale]
MELTAGTTKYRAVRAKLLDRISSLPVGERIPSEAELCDEFEVSRITLRHAVDGLVQDGRLAREHGRGTFVTEPTASERHPERFTDTVLGLHRQQTSEGHLVSTRVLRQELVPAEALVAEKLGIEVGDSVIKLVRLRYVDRQLHQHVVTYLPYERYPDVITADLSEASLFDFLEARYGVFLVRNDLIVRVEEASAEVALNLEVAPGLRLLTIDSTVADEGDVPVAFGTARHSPDTSEITLNLRSTRAAN